jgi:hypothetical protein
MEELGAIKSEYRLVVSKLSQCCPVTVSQGPPLGKSGE